MSSKYGGNYSIVGSDGELETYHDAYAGITSDVAERAMEVEQQIVERRERIEQSFLELAFLIDEFDANEYYKARGYATIKEWSESTEVEVGARVVHDLLRITREVMPLLQETNELPEAIELVANAKISKTRAMLPLVTDGMQDEFLDLLERAPEMTLRDVNKEVRMLRGNDDDADLIDVLFKAYVRRGDTQSRYNIIAMNGQAVAELGTLMIPNEYRSKFDDRFGKFLEVELEKESSPF